MATTSGLEQLAEEKEQELLLIRQQQAQAVQETLKGQLYQKNVPCDTENSKLSQI